MCLSVSFINTTSYACSDAKWKGGGLTWFTDYSRQHPSVQTNWIQSAVTAEGTAGCDCGQSWPAWHPWFPVSQNTTGLLHFSTVAFLNADSHTSNLIFFKHLFVLASFAFPTYSETALQSLGQGYIKKHPYFGMDYARLSWKLGGDQCFLPGQISNAKWSPDLSTCMKNGRSHPFLHNIGDNIKALTNAYIYICIYICIYIMHIYTLS